MFHRPDGTAVIEKILCHDTAVSTDHIGTQERPGHTVIAQVQATYDQHRCVAQ